MAFAAMTSVKREFGSSVSSVLAVYGAVVFAGQLEGQVNVALSQLAGKLVVGDAADHVRTQGQGSLYQVRGFGGREDSVLGEGDELEFAEVADLVAQFDQGSQGGEVFVADIYVAPDKERTLGHLPLYRLQRPALDVLFRKALLPLAPELYPLLERPALVKGGVSHGEGRVQVNVAVY